MSRKKIIVIGAGVSGLASALRLLNEGFEVELYEKNDQVGGRMGVISGDGFTFDLGPTILMMPQIYEEVFSCCGTATRLIISRWNGWTPFTRYILTMAPPMRRLQN
ncbi:phytoene desaturase family protein [Acetobacterium wieringae]|uniref:phytoene desaturase family protein n=1 Tax=Acetobacterium wieringae TaxID=52694 RepID=UPI002033A0A5|nr:FAD-dependent oxidoreductase [Acetobacterium wieringae]URN84581.1 FAD-dependent oxidoreductase [Acetobacterium wieringae]